MAKKEPAAAKVPTWDDFLACLSPAARQGLGVDPPPDRPADCDPAYARLHADLSPEARAAPARAAPPAEPPYNVIACPDGQWSLLKIYSGPDALPELAKYLGELDGSDTVVWVVRGEYLPITRGPGRLLLLSDRLGLPLPRLPGEPPRPALPVDGAALRAADGVQDDGYLGPPDLAESRAADSRPPARHADHTGRGDAGGVHTDV